MIAYNPKENLAKFKFLINNEQAELVVVGTPVAAVSNELVMLLEKEA